MDSSMFDYKNWCAPLTVYVILVVISAVLMLLGKGEFSQKLGNLVMQLIIAFLVAWLIKWLCDNNHMVLAWAIVFLPLILYLFFALLTGLIVVGTANRMRN